MFISEFFIILSKKDYAFNLSLIFIIKILELRLSKIQIYIIVCAILMLPNIILGQTGSIKGRVFNNANNQAIPFANVFLEGTSTGITSKEDGTYLLAGLKPGNYNVVCSFLGFKKAVKFEIQVSTVKPVTLDIGLTEDVKELESIEIQASPFSKTEESPVSMRTIGSTEIFRNPGGNRDISKVIQSLPGVATTVSFRNDIIIRGGAPNENRFYLDGIEVPNINHFATQGSSGGPVGMINVNFIREVDFYSGAFPSNRGNALSSVMEFKQIEGNDEKLTGNFTIGSSDIGLTMDGPIGKRSTLICSARRSYLQFLFKGLGLPFLPTYTDFQFKNTIKLNDKNKITIIGLGAIDDFELNQNANDKIEDDETIERNNYILGYLPINTQWNYTVGMNWQHFMEKSYQTVVISRNHLNNSAVKYQDNINETENLLFDYNSQEIENKFRFENTWRNNGWKLNYGMGCEQMTYTNSTFEKIAYGTVVNTVDFESDLNLIKYACFGQISKTLLNDRMIMSLGIRTDFNDYSGQMNNPFDQLSPRFSASYSLSTKWFLNFNLGRYFQLPPYTVLGYRDQKGILANKENEVTYIQSDHLVGGLEFNPNQYAKITIESFYKVYDNYPFLIKDSISLANLGGDFGIIGNEEVTSSSEGRSYGAELLLQQKLSKKFYGILAYTWVKSEFSDKDGQFRPSAWDNRNIISATCGKQFNKNWEVGVKFRYSGGSPYTPYDLERSSVISIWNVSRRGLPDYNRLNENRFSANHGMDIRIDKKWYLNKMTINLYMDIQNLYNFQAETQSFVTVVTDADGNPVISSTDPNSYETKLLENVSGTVLPSIGIMLEF